MPGVVPFPNELPFLTSIARWLALLGRLVGMIAGAITAAIAAILSLPWWAIVVIIGAVIGIGVGLWWILTKRLSPERADEGWGERDCVDSSELCHDNCQRSWNQWQERGEDRRDLAKAYSACMRCCSNNFTNCARGVHVYSDGQSAFDSVFIGGGWNPYRP
jgi:hypothetical protein